MEEVRGSEYSIRNCITKKIKTAHLANLTKYLTNDYHRTPEEASMRDIKDLFIVERIVGTAPENDLEGPVNNLQFKVEWKGYPGQDTWEPWKALRNLEIFRNYLSEHPKKAYRKLLRRILRRSEGRNDNQSVEADTGGTVASKNTKESDSDIRRKKIVVQPEEGIRKGSRTRKRTLKLRDS